MSKSILRPTDQCKRLFQDLASLTNPTLRLIMEILSRASVNTMSVFPIELVEWTGYPQAIINEALEELAEAGFITFKKVADSIAIRVLLKTGIKLTTAKALEDTRQLELSRLGDAPSSGSNELPPALRNLFAELGKIEAWPNVWLYPAELKTLKELYSEDDCTATAESLYGWSISHGVNPRTMIPHWKSYRANRDHFELICKRLNDNAQKRAGRRA